MIIFLSSSLGCVRIGERFLFGLVNYNDGLVNRIERPYVKTRP